MKKNFMFFFPMLIVSIITSACSQDLLEQPDMDQLSQHEKRLPGVESFSEKKALNNLLGRSLASGDNIALNKTAAASSYYSLSYLPEKSVDGLTSSCWGSQNNPAGDEWIYLDLGRDKDVTDIIIRWYYSYYAENYEVLVSSDASAWSSITTITGGDGGNDTISIDTECRYVKINCTRLNSTAYAIAELEVYGQKQYRIALIDCYAYTLEKINVRMVETDSSTDYTTESGGVLYTADSCQGVQGGFFENNNLFFTHDDPDVSDPDYLIKIDYSGTIQQQINLGSGIAPQEMIRADDGKIYMAYQNHWLTSGGIYKIDDSVPPDITNHTTNGVGAHYMTRVNGMIYLSHYGDWDSSYSGAKVEVFNPSDMSLSQTVNLTTIISTQCQNTRNVCYYDNHIYIACYDDYFAAGAISKVDSLGNTTAINLTANSPVAVIATNNHVYVGAETITNWDNIVESVFELDTTNNTIDESTQVNTSGYRIYNFKSYDNKIFATAVKNSKHYILVADESFSIEEEIEIYTNVKFPLLLDMEFYY